jgi:hypothetical protein
MSHVKSDPVVHAYITPLEAHFDIDITKSTINEWWKFCKNSYHLYFCRGCLVTRESDWGTLPAIQPIYLRGQERVDLYLISPLVSSWHPKVQNFSTKVYITIPTEQYLLLPLVAVIFCSYPQTLANIIIEETDLNFRGQWKTVLVHEWIQLACFDLRNFIFRKTIFVTKDII